MKKIGNKIALMLLLGSSVFSIGAKSFADEMTFKIVDAEDKAVENSKWELIKDGKVIDSFESHKEKFSFKKDLENGNYELKEVKKGDGYKLNEKSIKFTVPYKIVKDDKEDVAEKFTILPKFNREEKPKKAETPVKTNIDSSSSLAVLGISGATLGFGLFSKLLRKKK